MNFEEFLLFKKSSLQLPKDPSKINEVIFETVFPLYKEYLYFGGFPEVILKPTHEEKKKALEDIFTSYYQLEVLQLGDFRKNHVLRDSGLAHHHAQISEGSLFENNIFQCLRIRGKLNYYQRKSGHEIEFILNQEIGFEAKLSPAQNQLNQLIQLGTEIGLKEVKIVSLNQAFHLRPANKTTYGFLI